MKPLKSLFITITRPRFIITLIILTLLAALIGVMVPQLSDRSPSYFERWKMKSPITFYIVNTLQLDGVYTSVWFLILVFIILLSLGYSIYLQILRSFKRKQFIPPAEDGWDSIDTLYTVEPDSLIRFMGKKGYVLKNKNDALLIFSKNSFSRWGAAIFHSGLFLLIVAAVIGLAFQKRGFVQLMEGDVFSGRHDDFLVRELGVFQRHFDTGFKTYLSRFRQEYWDTDQIKAISSSLVLIDDNGNTHEHTLSVNRLVRYNGINIYQSFNYGYTLSFVLKMPDGREIITHFMLDRPDKKTKPFAGTSDFPETPYIFNMKFYPDISMNSFYLGRPILNLRVLKGVGRMVFDGLIIPGDVVNVDGNLLRFFNISSWSGFIYVKGIDMSAAYLGFFISCLGATIMFLLPHKEVFISQKGPVLSLYGRTNRYKPLFLYELERIKMGIKGIC